MEETKGDIASDVHSPPDSIETVVARDHGIKRGLSSRHAQFIALGSSIGTGLFVSSGETLAKGGPAFFLGSYIVVSFFMYIVMSSLTEVAAYLPLSGGPMSYYGSRYVSRSLGFMMGWLYFYAFAIFIPYELTASALVIEYWHPDVNNAVWITIMLVLIVALNVLPVRFYGESEFWFSLLKVITLVGLIILAFILFWGGGPSHDRLGFRYWKDPGAVNTLIVGGNAGRFVAALATLITSVLPYDFSPEMIIVTGGEMKSPRRNLPTAARTYLVRLIIFYVLGTLGISVICPSNAASLFGSGTDASSSPWVVGIQNAGIKGLDSVINAVVITSAASAGNAFLYLASRSLYSMSLEGNAPRIFQKCTKQGVPIYAVGASALFTALAYMNVNQSAADVFNWLVNLVNCSAFISWVCCSIIHIRFRKACKTQQIPDSEFPSRSPFKSGGSYVTLVLFALLCLLNGFTVFFPSQWSVADFLSAYIGLPVFVLIYLVHRAWSWSDPWAIPPHLVDLHTGLEEIKADEDLSEPEKPWSDRLKSWAGSAKIPGLRFRGRG